MKNWVMFLVSYMYIKCNFSKKRGSVASLPPPPSLSLGFYFIWSTYVIITWISHAVYLNILNISIKNSNPYRAHSKTLKKSWFEKRFNVLHSLAFTLAALLVWIPFQLILCSHLLKQIKGSNLYLLNFTLLFERNISWRSLS